MTQVFQITQKQLRNILNESKVLNGNHDDAIIEFKVTDDRLDIEHPEPQPQPEG